MGKLKFAVLGCGFWSKFQIGAWSELEGVELVAVYNRTISKAQKIADYFKVPATYDDPEKLFRNEKLDFIDIITDVDTHAHFVNMAVKNGIKHIICQKPMAPDFETAKGMVELCKNAGAKLYIHENYRWQAPVRRLKQIIDSGVTGKPFKARVSFLSGYPVFDNQPFLKELDHFILTDMGSHVLDVTRYLFGECNDLWCETRAVNKGIKGEDLAVIMMNMKNGMPVYTEMSYASIVEHDSFSTLHILVEGEKGSVYLGPKFEIRITTKTGTVSETVKFPSYTWADPDYIVNHESGIHVNRNILEAIQGTGKAENTGDDNLETVRLIWACYNSAKSGKKIRIEEFI
ncbi:MAG: oxidoreductase [Bacteroidetes bacterium GWE2_41_25]|nr:MAG: oxidoreductase [Bacteroidetes bacterium GWE2_41_25]OFX97630.1 MAG: oxidoreductase [Bacteroidetes bacterium GWC2_40_22]OFY58938.1 MAG: oxidoreductase [Bacteroidetes bacterium GWF2_41_9]HBH83852.1 gfo/Idh/MocA family oxidoreductase [Bacteroidales bacterium]HCU20320.1 gfo/Idh/MocA family oxidoreductase [Bacteroidales bacterium]